MNASKAFLAGVIAGIAMSILMALGRAVGIPLNAEVMLGTMVGLAPEAFGTWLTGFAIHLAISGVIGLAYGWGFENVTGRAGVGPGMLFAIVHVAIAGFVMGMMPALHPMIPEPMAAPGLFMVNMGAAAVALFVVEHFVYGAITGGIYAAEPSTMRQREVEAPA